MVCSGRWALKIDLGAIGCPLRLPADGLYARLLKWWPARAQAVRTTLIAQSAAS